MIEIEGLSRRYGDADAVHDVSMTVETGTITAIVGPSGAGKTTLLRMINRLVEPTAGSVRIDGTDTRALPGHVLRRGIGYAIQGHGLFPHRTVAENIATVPVLLGWPPERIARRIGDLLALFALDDLGPRYPHQLSGGQQQRVGVARALAGEPRLLLMDEPFGALDPILRHKAQQDLRTVSDRFGTTIVLVTHDMEEAILLGDRIAVLDGGRLVQHAAPAEILSRPAAPVVERLVAAGDRPFKLLSLASIADAVEAGDAEGMPLPADATLRDALAALLWSGRPALPVAGADGRRLGRITLDGLARRARPQ